MFAFQFYNPTRIHFGNGSLSKAGDVVQGFGNSALLVTGGGRAQAGKAIESLGQLLRSSGISTTVVNGVTPNPRLDQLVEMANRFKGQKFDCVVALGGGSVMDAAKILSLILTHADNPWEYRVTGSLSVPAIKDSMLPVVTIPTTAGTGSEISPAALITHDHRKEVYFSPFMYPKATIIDPSLSVTLPADLTAQIGMDAFIQSLEAYVSVAAQPFSDMYAIQSMRIVLESLPLLVNNLSDLNLRGQLAFAGFLSCYAIGQAGVGAVHALSDPISARYDVGHGLALSILLPEVMRANLDSNIPKFASLAKSLGSDTSGLSQSVAAGASIRLVEDLLRRLDLANRRLSDFGIVEGDLPTFAEEAENPDMATNPKKLSKDQRISIYKSVM